MAKACFGTNSITETMGSSVIIERLWDFLDESNSSVISSQCHRVSEKVTFFFMTMSYLLQEYEAYHWHCHRYCCWICRASLLCAYQKNKGITGSSVIASVEGFAVVADPIRLS